MIYKIVQGNSFKLHVLVRKMDVSKEFQRLIDFDMNLATDISVELHGCFCDTVSVPIQVAGIQGNILICDIPPTLELGNYNIKVSWKYEGSEMVSIERNLLRIVDHNSQSNIPVGIVEGEHTGLFDLRYYVVTRNQSSCPISFIIGNLKFNYTIDGKNVQVDQNGNFTYDTSIENGKSLEAIIQETDGMIIDTVKVIMDGSDRTDEYYDKENHRISIPAASGYITIAANGTNKANYYGASAANNICDLSLSELTLSRQPLVGKTFTIETTEEKPYIWFISRKPLIFNQCGFDVAMNTYRMGELYFYCSDALIPGDDNEYTIKHE